MTILIIDDEERLRQMLARLLTLEGYSVVEAETIKEGRRKLARGNIDIVLCDVRLPDGNGVAFSGDLLHEHPEILIILLTAYGDVSDGVQAMKNGAFDYIVKGDDNMRIIPLLAKACEQIALKRQVARLERDADARYTFDSILGSSDKIRVAKEMAKKVAPTDANVLLLGETGTGKEVFARAIHFSSSRKSMPFLALNCSSFSRELLESEIFGYKAGAFTNAQRDKKGLIEEAQGGTLFLDEIGEMPPELQSKLLRVLESGEFIKLGDTRVMQANVRIVAATNRDLQKEITNGKFREDLYYRLNSFTINLPPLRERKKDIPILAKHFMGIYSLKNHFRTKEMSPEFEEALVNHLWRGNIRELKNIMERAVIMAGDERISVSHLPQDFFMEPNDLPLSSLDLAAVEKAHIKRVLQMTNNNKAEAARLLNIGLATLYRKLDEPGLQT